MKECIFNTNCLGQYHGYQERYLGYKLVYRGNWKNGKETGYEEWYYIKQTTYHIK